MFFRRLNVNQLFTICIGWKVVSTGPMETALIKSDESVSHTVGCAKYLFFF